MLEKPKYTFKNKGFMGIAEHALVATCNLESARIGLSILREGGSAVDAFIASTFADYILSPGVTSMAGGLCLLSYDINKRQILNLHAGFKKLSQNGVFIPGAISGLWTAHKKQGKLPWKNLLQPAIALAQNGVPISALYENILIFRKDVLHSSYAKNVYFRSGEVLKEGQILRQPLLAETLNALSREGEAYFYRGAWATSFAEHMGPYDRKEILNDLMQYKAIWVRSWRHDYQGHSIYMAGPPSFGAVKLSLALKLLKFFNISKRAHWFECSETLKLMLCICRVVEQENWFYKPVDLNTVKSLEDHFSNEAIHSLAEKVLRYEGNASYQAPPFHQTCHTIIIDELGNIVSGTHTIGSLPWGNGVFVGGVPLPSLDPSFYKNCSSSFLPEAYSIQIILKGKKVRFVNGFFSTSMFPADLQVIPNLLDFRMPLSEAFLYPRFGTFAYSFQNNSLIYDYSKNFIDKRFPYQVIQKLESQGMMLRQENLVDTGLGVGIEISYAPFKISGIVPETLEGAVIGY